MLTYPNIPESEPQADLASSTGASEPQIADRGSAQVVAHALSTRIMASAEERYRTLLDMSSTLADQPTVKAMVHTLRGLLSSTCDIHGAHLYILNSEQNGLYLFEFDQAPDAPLLKTGIRIARSGAPAQVLDEQKPIYLPDLSQELSKIPELAHLAPESVGRTTYLFPVSTSQQQYGFFAVTKDRGQQFLAEDVELLGSLASHLAVALECAVARDNAERYQQQVAKERDRLKLPAGVSTITSFQSSTLMNFFRQRQLPFGAISITTSPVSG